MDTKSQIMTDIQIFKRHYITETTNEHITTNIALDLEDILQIETYGESMIKSRNPLCNVVTDAGYVYILEADFVTLVNRWKIARKQTFIYSVEKN